MKVILKNDENETKNIIINDEGFDSQTHWINVLVENNGNFCSIDIKLRDLMGALIGFDAQRNYIKETEE